jgi:nitric oxide reductase NorE protein
MRLLTRPTANRRIPPDIGEPAESSARHVPGEPGIWIFIFGDMSVFILFFATYLFYRGKHSALYADSQRLLEQGLGATYTVVLLCSSLAVCVGMRALRQRGSGRTDNFASRSFVIALACGVLFVVLKVLEYRRKLAGGITPTTNEFFMYYFVLTGLHLFHLVIGIGILSYLARVARRSAMTGRQYALVEGGACYWHMVDLLWIVIFALVYLVK